ncbi:MAG TPA: hypothetical protein VHS53_10420, partial [Mucilaginibacter sp.]|nr:hypothetical protein [Mucilaginibacter sp.]
KNTFEGAVMYYSDVSTYYPINANYPDFDHFVFQQTLPDSGNSDNNYGLCAYAVFTAVSGIPPVMVGLGAQKRTGKPYKAPAGVQFANMKLDQDGLANLYPPGVTVDMVLTAKDLYSGTNYVYYTASTNDDSAAGGSVNLNPSPPFNG